MKQAKMLKDLGHETARLKELVAEQAFNEATIEKGRRVIYQASKNVAKRFAICSKN